MDGLYWESWYNNRNLTQDELGYIYYENKLLGVARMRQLKVGVARGDLYLKYLRILEIELYQQRNSVWGSLYSRTAMQTF